MQHSRTNPSKPYHFPGFNYMGPGTDVAYNVANHVRPVNQTDAAAVVHDIEYMLTAGDLEGASRADYNAVHVNSAGISRIPMLLGLGARHVLSLNFNNDVSGHDRVIGQRIKRYISEDQDWKNILRPYKLKWMDGQDVVPTTDY